jgi:hypothetical protein
MQTHADEDDALEAAQEVQGIELTTQQLQQQLAATQRQCRGSIWRAVLQEDREGPPASKSAAGAGDECPPR